MADLSAADSAVGGAHAAALAPVSLVPQADGSVVHFPHLIERAKPGLIAVTPQGVRFCMDYVHLHCLFIFFNVYVSRWK